jgi:hypothetical protein
LLSPYIYLIQYTYITDKKREAQRLPKMATAMPTRNVNFFWGGRNVGVTLHSLPNPNTRAMVSALSICTTSTNPYPCQACIHACDGMPTRHDVQTVPIPPPLFRYGERWVVVYVSRHSHMTYV